MLKHLCLYLIVNSCKVRTGQAYYSTYTVQPKHDRTLDMNFFHRYKNIQTEQFSPIRDSPCMSYSQRKTQYF
jgi:hypothetical protein